MQGKALESENLCSAQRMAEISSTADVVWNVGVIETLRKGNGPMCAGPMPCPPA